MCGFVVSKSDHYKMGGSRFLNIFINNNVSKRQKNLNTFFIFQLLPMCNHEKCSSYFSKGAKKGELNLITDMEKCGI